MKKIFAGNPIRTIRIGFIMGMIAVSWLTSAQVPGNSLINGFKDPPESAKPRTWWHWTNSNVTKEGITKDLEWMKRIGIGGMQLADVASGQGQIVEKKLFFRSPEWLDAVHHAASEADRLNLEMTIFSSAGWSLTGGPWVKPEQAMKKLVWSATNLKGPLNYNGKLPSPPSVEGPVRNLSRAARVSESDPKFYKDCIVLAFPTPQDEIVDTQPVPVASTGAGTVDPAVLIDDDLSTSMVIRSGKDKKQVWIKFSFEKEFTARAITMANRAGIPVGNLAASNDGNTYRTIVSLPGAQLYRSGKVATFSFPETSARYFRLEFTGAPMKPGEVMAETTTLPDSLYTFSELKLHTGARINRWEDKAGFYHLFNYEPVESGEVSASSVIDPASVIDLTSKMLPNGSIEWKVPAGNWTIMRFGYSLTGSKNRPAVPAGSGYEVDKLSKEHTLAYIKEYTAPISGVLGTLYGKSLQSVMLDSWEAGMQNWTDSMLYEFRNRRGYDLTPFLPALSGYVVGNSDISDRVLWDFRRTLADMFAENHYAVLTEFLNKQGIKTYGEASGVSLEILEDALLCKKYVDYPMGEFWYRALHPELMYYQDVRGAASASHIYGKKITAAESFTGGGFESPNTLKKIGDYWFAQGINRFVFHTSAHQPLDTKPGNTMVGTHINRNITWAEQASPFMTYLARNSFMLQQGRFVADLAFLLDEGAPSTMPVWGTGLNPAPPEGYDYDYINADVLINRMSVGSDGKLLLPDGMSYAVLVLPNTTRMTLPVAKKIRDLVNAGATVVGCKPERTQGYTGYPGSEKNLSEIVSEVWADLDGVSRTRRTVGKGKVFWGTPLKTVLEASGIQPDFEYGKGLDSKIDWIHRKTDDADIYFVVNSTDRPIETELRFRVTGREAEIWDPATGEVSPSSYSFSANMTVVPVKLTERQSAFFVFSNTTSFSSGTKVLSNPVSTAEIKGPWEIYFPSGLGAPEKITTDTLKSWTENSDEGIKFFSGTASYRCSFVASGLFMDKGTRYLLDLGRVGDIAEVIINGYNAGLVWKDPFTADITGHIRKGVNKIEIKVTNEWTNRIIGDLKAAPDKKILNSPLFVFGNKLNESGLIGPVKILKY
ncbi:MAG: glycoside hydrolase [Bacteroidales bacterium]|nr:glycoside hydrolase [Bacteroidales bacterium]